MSRQEIFDAINKDRELTLMYVGAGHNHIWQASLAHVFGTVLRSLALGDTDGFRQSLISLAALAVGWLEMLDDLDV